MAISGQIFNFKPVAAVGGRFMAFPIKFSIFHILYGDKGLCVAGQEFGSSFKRCSQVSVPYYLPWEIYELARRQTWIRWTILGINVIIAGTERALCPRLELTDFQTPRGLPEGS